jgi:predicted metal-dependent hydrolase
MQVKKQSPKDRFIQLVFDFFAPLVAEQKGALVAEPVNTNSGKSIETSTKPHNLQDKARALSSLFIHPCATHALDIKGVEVHYLLRRAKRKTIGMLVSHEGLEVRAPKWVSLSQVQMALNERGDWLIKQFNFMDQKLKDSARFEIQIESGCVGPVLDQGVQWMFHSLKAKGSSGYASGHASGDLSWDFNDDLSPTQESLSRLQRENQKRLRSPLGHIEIQRMQGGQWLECTWIEWIHGLLERALCFEAGVTESRIARDATDATDALYRVYLPIGSLLKLLSAGKIGGAGHSQGWAGDGVAKASAKQWIDAVQIHLAQLVLNKRVAYFSGILGVKPSAITLGQAKSRWGSAGSNGAIRLNWHLINLPMSLLDYVVAHELCHLKQMNHGPEFWAEMQTVMPDFAQRRHQLKSWTMAKWV